MISLAFEDKECVRNRTMWHKMEPGMKTASESFQLCIFLCKKTLLYMVFEPRTLTLSFLRSTDSPIAAEIHNMVFIYVYHDSHNSSNLADSVRVAGDILFILRHLTLIYSCIYFIR